MTATSGAHTRVLLVTARAEEVKSLGGPMARERFAVSHARSASAAAEAIQKHAFDAIVLCHPLPDAEPIGSCAALAATPGCPPILLLDVVDRSDEVKHTLPADVRPALCLVRPLDGAKLPVLVTQVIDATEEPDASVDRRGFANVLLDLAQRGETGALEVRAESATTRIYFRRGAPVSVEGGSLRETLGRMLVRRGALSESDYERVIRRMTERVIDNEHQRMGEVLIELGLLSGAEVYQALSGQATEKIVACFAPARVDLIFHEMDALPPAIEALAVPPVPALLLEIVRQHFSEQEVAKVLAPHARDRLRLVGGAAGLKLAGEEARFAASLNGARSASELLRAHPSAAATLAALLLMGAAEPTAAAPPDKPQPAASPAPRASAQFARDEVVMRKRPTASAGGATTQTRPAAPAPAPADESKARLEAEQLFQEARKLLEREKFHDACEALQRVVTLRPLEPEYRMYEAWAGYLAARVVQRIARSKAIACARKVSETDPRAAKPHAILGRLLLEDGDAKAATREFELALLRDPAEEDAKKGLSLARGGK